MYIALVNNETNIVENVIIMPDDQNWQHPEGYTAINTDTAGIGWLYINGVFTNLNVPPNYKVPIT